MERLEAVAIRQQGGHRVRSPRTRPSARGPSIAGVGGLPRRHCACSWRHYHQYRGRESTFHGRARRTTERLSRRGRPQRSPRRVDARRGANRNGGAGRVPAPFVARSMGVSVRSGRTGRGGWQQAGWHGLREGTDRLLADEEAQYGADAVAGLLRPVERSSAIPVPLGREFGLAAADFLVVYPDSAGTRRNRLPRARIATLLGA